MNWLKTSFTRRIKIDSGFPKRDKKIFRPALAFLNSVFNLCYINVN
jgi:hypothetical protein